MASSIATAQITLTTTPTQLVAVRGSRTNLSIKLLSGAGLNYIGPTGVTISTGYLLPSEMGQELSFAAFTGEVWGISRDVSGNIVSVVEIF